MTCDGWDVTHERVRINFAFHGYAEDINAMYNIKDKLIPCLELVTSDIGENAFEATRILENAKRCQNLRFIL